MIVSDLRANTSPDKVEKTIFLKLDNHLVPGPGKALRGWDDLQAERQAQKESAADAKNTAVGDAGVTPAAVS